MRSLGSRRWLWILALLTVPLAVAPHVASARALPLERPGSPSQWAAVAPVDTAGRSRPIERFTAPRCNGTNSVTSKDGRYLFTNEWLGKRAFLCVIDLREKRLMKRVLLKDSSRTAVETIDLSSDGGFLYIEVSDVERHPILGWEFSYSSVVVVDAGTFKVVGSFTPRTESSAGDEGMSIFGLTHLADDTVVFALHGAKKDGFLLTADVRNGNLNILSVRAPNDINNIVVSSDGATLWALGDGIARMDAVDGQVLATSLKVGGTFPKIPAHGLALSPDEQTLHMIDSSRRMYMVLDAETLKVKRSMRLSYIPKALAMTPDGRRVWILASFPLPRVPGSWPPPDYPDEVWTFDFQGRQTGRIVLPDPGGAESLVFDPSGINGYITFRKYPNASEVLVLRTR